MKKSQLYLNYFTMLLLVFSGPFVSAQDPAADSSEICISPEEEKLYNLINDYRKILKLNQIPLSYSLCLVAKKHVDDLLINHPDTMSCNYHSWSDKGAWKPCCYGKNTKSKSCMTEKPAELTSYPGIAYELVYWDNREATASDAFDQWKTIPASKDMIINIKKWEETEWNGMGVAIKGNFAILWLGPNFDVIKETPICNSKRIIKNENAPDSANFIVKNKTGRFYLVVASLPQLNEAHKIIKDLAAKGYRQAKIIQNDGKFRVSAVDYPTKEHALPAKNRLKADYKDVWIMEF